MDIKIREFVTPVVFKSLMIANVGDELETGSPEHIVFESFEYVFDLIYTICSNQLNQDKLTSDIEMLPTK